jgi:hypothetical protein
MCGHFVLNDVLNVLSLQGSETPAAGGQANVETLAAWPHGGRDRPLV